MLIVVAIVAVLAGVGFGYYTDYIEDARRNTVLTNLKTVKEAVGRYFKDRMVYPTSLNELQGPYLQQNPNQLLLGPIQPADPNAKIEIYVPDDPAKNAFHTPETEMIWTDNLNIGRQIKNIRINYRGNFLY
jgi:Tfp pilus assembly protein PilE